MKKIILFALCLLTLSASAQDNRHDIRISYGIGKDRHFNNIRNDIEGFNITDIFLLPLSELKNYNLTLNLEYYYHLGKHIAVGAMTGGIFNGKYERVITGEPIAGEELKTPTARATLTGHALYFMPAAKWTWYRNKVVAIYSKAGFGARRYKLDVESNYYPERHENKWKTAFQLSPVGVEVGWPHFKLFTDYGFGHQGYINAGLACLF